MLKKQVIDANKAANRTANREASSWAARPRRGNAQAQAAARYLERSAMASSCMTLVQARAVETQSSKQARKG